MRVAFWGNFGTQNFGNECTLHAMLEAARRHLPEAELVGVSNGPADTRQRHRVDALAISPDPALGFRGATQTSGRLRRLVREARDWLRVVGEMRKIDMLVMTGTGMLTDTSESMFGMPYQMLKWTVSSRLWGRKVAFVSVGAEGLNDRLQSSFLGWSLRLAQFRSYRDLLSKQRAQSLYGGASVDPIYPDLAFSLPRSPPVQRKASDRGTTVAVGIYAVEGGADAIRSYINEVGTFLLWLLDRGYQPRIVFGDAEYDEAIRIGLKAWLETRNATHKVLDERASSFEELTAQLSQADLVVATRFHNVLLALMQEKPVLSVSHMDKNDQLMAAMGLESYCMPLANVRHDDLVVRFAELEKNAGHVRSTIGQKLALFREQLEVQYSLVFSGLKR